MQKLPIIYRFIYIDQNNLSSFLKNEHIALLTLDHFRSIRFLPRIKPKINDLVAFLPQKWHNKNNEKEDIITLSSQI